VTEIAEEMDISHSNASRYLGLAREKLRQGLGKYPTGTVTLHSAAIPFSAVIAGVLKQESFAFNPGNMEWLGAALSQYRAQIHQQRSLPHNTVAETLFWPAVAALSAVVMTAGIFLGASHYEALQLPVSSSPVTGQINFVGGEEKDATLICQNPTGASPQMNNADGALTAFEWFITPADSDARLYSGEGGDADAALLQLRESGEAGKYILHVLFQDDSGNVYRAYESFLVGSAV
jgi:hypothetical protein